MGSDLVRKRWAGIDEVLDVLGRPSRAQPPTGVVQFGVIVRTRSREGSDASAFMGPGHEHGLSGRAFAPLLRGLNPPEERLAAVANLR